jgi:hypothetical protein
MARINTTAKRPPVYTAGGANAAMISAEKKLRRSLMACMLWEDSFYEGGMSIAERIAELIGQVDPHSVFNMAIETRLDMKIRHAPLLIANLMLRHPEHKKLVGQLLPEIIKRADELSEILAIYWGINRQAKPKRTADHRYGKRVPIPWQFKVGLASAFRRFDEYQLAKYRGDDKVIKLRDVLCLVHPRPIDEDQATLWGRLRANTLATPDTWEVAISACGNDKEAKRLEFERLLSNNKMGALAVLRNLRNFKDNGVNEKLVFEALDRLKPGMVLPFQFISAAQFAPQWENKIEQAMLKYLDGYSKLPGKTVLIIDVSGSMRGNISAKSDRNRLDVAAALAVIARERCVDARIYCTAGNDHTRVHQTALVAPRYGFALIDAVKKAEQSLGGGGIFLKQAMDYVKREEGSADRVIVFTDEQDCDAKGSKGDPTNADTSWATENYLINVSIEKNGIGYGKWTHIDGWSEHVMDYIRAYESSDCRQ